MPAVRTLSPKENLLRHYRHEKPDFLPVVGEALKSIFPIHAYYERPEGSGGTVDCFGVQYVFEAATGASIPDINAPRVITDITKWEEQLKIPDPDTFDWEGGAKIDKVDELPRDTMLIQVLLQAGLWERTHALMGMSEAYVALVTEPDAMMAMISALAEYKLKIFDKIIKYYKVDIMRQHDDYGAQNAMQMSPEMWRKFIKPHTAKFVEFCHKQGVFFEQHSCGFIEPIVPDFAEVGVDSWNGMHINDVPKLKKITGESLNYYMSLNVPDYYVMDKVGKLDEAWLREDVHKMVSESAEGGNYFCTFGALRDPDWWGTPIIAEEVEKIRVQLTY